MNQIKSKMKEYEIAQNTDLKVVQELYGVHISIDESHKNNEQSKALYRYLISSLKSFHNDILDKKMKWLILRRESINHGYYLTFIYKIFEVDSYKRKTLIDSIESRNRGYKTALCIFTEHPFSNGKYEKRKGWHQVSFSEKYKSDAEKTTFKKEIEEYTNKNIQWEVIQLEKQDDENSSEYMNT